MDGLNKFYAESFPELTQSPAVESASIVLPDKIYTLAPDPTKAIENNGKKSGYFLIFLSICLVAGYLGYIILKTKEEKRIQQVGY